jgi:hypothetical protein
MKMTAQVLQGPELIRITYAGSSRGTGKADPQSPSAERHCKGCHSRWKARQAIVSPVISVRPAEHLDPVYLRFYVKRPDD